MIMDTTEFFDSYYEKAELNSLVIMDAKGTILDVNQSFTHNFGYSNADIRGQNFSILFSKSDNEKDKPRMELETVATKGQAQDENYIVDKNGHAIWCTGESILVAVQGKKEYIVKDIVNLQAKKQLLVFLTEMERLLERIFETSKEIPIMILDGGMKIKKVNEAFLHLFEMTNPPAEGDRLSDLHHPFWTMPEIRDELRRITVSKESTAQREFVLHTKSGETKIIRFSSKVTEGHGKSETKIFVLLDDLGEQ